MVREIKIKKRYVLSKKEKKKIINKNLLKNKFTIKDNIERVEFDSFSIYLVNGTPIFIESKEELIYPSLLYLIHSREKMVPEVRVDRGAAQAVGRGATLMVPGIRSLDEFDKGEIVAVVDEDTGIPVAIGVALMSSAEIREKLSAERRGRAVKIIHKPGDIVWKAAEMLYKL